MSSAPTTDQIKAALKRARHAARELTEDPERLLLRPLYPRESERIDPRWWLIGRLAVLGQPEQWELPFDPETDAGRQQRGT